MSSKLDQLSQWSVLVADSGDLEAVRRYQPEDATTNPSLLLAVAGDERYADTLEDARRLASELGDENDLGLLNDCFAVTVGKQLTDIVGGQVSTEVDARLSFDTTATVERARRLAALYRELGVEPDRYLIKVAGTWEGIRAADVLETEGIRCNVTLVFSLVQARAAAEAGATLVSPFVGRILDWHVRHRQVQVKGADDDPGVQSVRTIYDYLKGRGFDTIVMGASFRNLNQIEGLAGCDRLTISPKLLAELAGESGPLTRQLDESRVELIAEEPALTEASFRWNLNQDPAAGDLLADGIRRFTADQQALEKLLKEEVHV